MPELQKAFEAPEILVLTGMRQVGKTTLLRWIFDQVKSSNKVMLDAENPLHRKLFEEENFDNIWINLSEFGITSQSKAYIFIDEIQLMPEITRAVKYLYDHYQVKFCLTGSSSYYLKNFFPESLAGRKVLLELYPLTWPEFLTFKGQKISQEASWKQKSTRKSKTRYELYHGLFAEYLRFGGFPKVVLAKNKDRKAKILSDIFTSYFEHDVKSLADVREISRLRDLILLLAPRIGSKLDITKLASELSLSRETVYSYLAFLEATYFLYLLPRHSASPDRRAAGSRKVYISDTGLARLLGELSSGQALENSVVQILRPHHQLSYWSNKRGGEIDLIVDDKTGLEVKVSTSSQDKTTLSKRADSAGLAESFLVSGRYSESKRVIPVVEL